MSDSPPDENGQAAQSAASLSGLWQLTAGVGGRLPIAAALRRVRQKGYKREDLVADLFAGTVVGIVALPLSMALAIAVGVPPQHGLYTAIVAGAITAVLGGCKFQVTGPTAAFVVILAPIATKYGLSGLLTAGFLAGLMLVAAGVARLGHLIEFIPYPVTTGFTTGIATVIATLQLKDFFGLELQREAAHFTEKVYGLWQARGTARLSEIGVATLTLALLLTVPRITKRIPAALIALGLVSVLVVAIHWVAPSFSVATIGTRFHTVQGGVEVAGIPRGLPAFMLPWGQAQFSFELVRELFSAAFAIAMLGAIESLLSAVIADGMTGTKHEPNSELVGLGIGNILAPLFGGVAATGALARTATNIRAGARSPLAAVTHALVVLLSMLTLAPLISYIPMASLAALLVLVAWNMSELTHFLRMLKIAPRSDVTVMITCYVLTVFFDMVIAVSVGVVLAAMLFMRRMAELTEGHVLSQRSWEEHGRASVPQGVVLYEIEGPLFFGAAQNAMRMLTTVPGKGTRVLVLALGKVPTIDATGLVALEGAIRSLQKNHTRVVIAGPLPRPRSVLDNAALQHNHPGLEIRSTLGEALDLAAQHAAQIDPAPASRPGTATAPPPP
jgi:SulP family sulfate permease